MQKCLNFCTSICLDFLFISIKENRYHISYYSQGNNIYHPNWNTKMAKPSSSQFSKDFAPSVTKVYYYIQDRHLIFYLFLLIDFILSSAFSLSNLSFQFTFMFGNTKSLMMWKSKIFHIYFSFMSSEKNTEKSKSFLFLWKTKNKFHYKMYKKQKNTYVLIFMSWRKIQQYKKQ